MAKKQSNTARTRSQSRKAAQPARNGRWPAPTHSQIFHALNAIDLALSEVEGTMRLLSNLIDNDDEGDTVLVGAIERHLLRDLAALSAAKDRAWGNLLQEADHDR